MSRRATLALDVPRILAIVNLTPDSFYDGGSCPTVEAAIDACRRAVDAEADVLDLGGESTRPGAGRVPAEEQIKRVAPVIEALRRQPPPLGEIPLSIDTTLEAVARAALDAGADAINDVSAGTEDPAILDLAASRGAGLILMHRLAPPPQDSYSDAYRKAPPVYSDVVTTVRDFLDQRARSAQRAGVDRASIVVDPGLGFGKTVEQNLELIRRTPEIAALGYPVLSGASRKSFVGRVTLGRDSTPDERLIGSVAFSIAHYLAGARIFRVHDIPAHVQALRAAAHLAGRG